MRKRTANHRNNGLAMKRAGTSGIIKAGCRGSLLFELRYAVSAMALAGKIC